MPLPLPENGIPEGALGCGPDKNASGSCAVLHGTVPGVAAVTVPHAPLDRAWNESVDPNARTATEKQSPPVAVGVNDAPAGTNPPSAVVFQF